MAWVRVPDPIPVFSSQLDEHGDLMPVADPVWVDVDGERLPKLNTHGSQLLHVLPPWTVLEFFERFVFGTRFMPGGPKGAKMVRRVRRRLRVAETQRQPRSALWVQMDDGDVEEIRAVMNRIEKFVEKNHDNPSVGLIWDQRITEQCLDLMECWEVGQSRDKLPDGGQAVVHESVGLVHVPDPTPITAAADAAEAA